jgi:hypothetical protein
MSSYFEKHPYGTQADAAGRKPASKAIRTRLIGQRIREVVVNGRLGPPSLALPDENCADELRVVKPRLVRLIIAAAAASTSCNHLHIIYMAENGIIIGC